MPTRPGDALLDFQWATTPLIYLAQLVENDAEASDLVRALCGAIFQVHERADQALGEVVSWSDGRAVARE